MAGMLPCVETLRAMEEFFAAGYFEEPDASPAIRWSRAVRRRLEHQAVAPYDGGLLTPCGRVFPSSTQNRFLAPSYSFTWDYRDAAVAKALETEADPDRRQALEALRREMRAELERLNVGQTPHTIGGWGYTHSIPHYGRVLREGLQEHARRVEAGLATAREQGDTGKVEFYLGLRDVLIGVRVWHANLTAALAAAPVADETAARNRQRLLEALAQVPFLPARSFFEAVVAYNFIYYLDGCDNPGRMDQELQPYYAADLAIGHITRQEAAALVAALCDSVKVNGGWSAAIGGKGADGRPAYNDVTLMILEAAHGRYRPSLELRVLPSMPDTVWEAALDAVGTGAGNPAFYNEEAYLQGLHEDDLGLTPEDMSWWNGGGCTETMIHGRSNVGSLEAGLHLPLVFEPFLKRELPRSGSFAALLEAFRGEVAGTIAEVVACINRNQAAKAARRPQPLRSLLIDDCIERGVDFVAGGARYNWSVVNIAGLANVVDSLAAVREVVFEKREMAARDLLSLLESNFEGAEATRRRLMRCPRFGNDDPAVDDLAADLAGFVFGEFRRHRPWRGGRFLPSCIMFVTWAAAGAQVGATPDGRPAREPLSDCIGPVQGRDTHGPTAMLKSVARLPLRLATGTPVLNMRLAKPMLQTPEGRAGLRGLVETFFRMGGMQLQLSVVSKEELEDAIAHPERHGDLVVRVGGYSDYFNNLSPEMKHAILTRTEYAVGSR